MGYTMTTVQHSLSGSGSVFDISQTEGKELPAPPAPAILQSESDLGKALYRYLSSYAVDRGGWVARQSQELLGDSNGYYDPRNNEIAVSARLPIDAAAK